ncbi:MAG TPA: SDR family NAD(P)-dependent oxidoreductase [Thermoanaerobaculia bacterium]|nr:SDR family NAD(P)-dependent oxidoreductase [Thermoanaerobaculia bacterium]
MKTVVITGGTGGLGSVVTPRLERDYRCVLLTHAMADLRDEASVQQAFAGFGEIYALVHLVGGFAMGSVAETSAQAWSEMFALNLTGAFTAARAALPHLTRPGRIVAVSSVAALEKSAGMAAYVVSKSALQTLVEVIAKENPGISANVVASATLTDALKKDVAETIAFLLSDAAASISGTIVPLR